MGFFQEYKKEMKKTKAQPNAPLSSASFNNKSTDDEDDAIQGTVPALNTAMPDTIEVYNSEQELAAMPEPEFMRNSDLFMNSDFMMNSDLFMNSDFMMNSDLILDPEPVKEPDSLTVPDSVQEEAAAVSVQQVELSDETDFDPIKVSTPSKPWQDGNCCYISKGTQILGSMTSEEDVIMEGTLEGDLTCDKGVTINGSMHGDINAASLCAGGKRLIGSVSCTGDVRIQTACVMIGDITAQSFHLEGAVRGNAIIQGAATMSSSSVFQGDLQADSLTQKYGSLAEGHFKIGKSPVID